MITNTTTVYTNTDLGTAQAVANRINQAFAIGYTVIVNGTHEVASWTGTPSEAAWVWGNGSLSVDVKTKNGRRITQVWAKVGQQITVEVKS